MARIYLDANGSLILEGFHFTEENTGGVLHVEGVDATLRRCRISCPIMGWSLKDNTFTGLSEEERAGSIAQSIKPDSSSNKMGVN